MKRILVTSLMVVYLAFSVGVVIDYHFCGGKLDEVSLFKQSKTCCADTNTSNSCCHDSVTVFKISNEYNGDFISPDVPQDDFIALSQTIFYYTIQHPTGSLNDEAFDLHQLRHLSKQPVYLINSVFII